MKKRGLILLACLILGAALPAAEAMDEERFIEIFAQAYGEAAGRATVDYLIRRYEARYGRYGDGLIWSGYRVYTTPGLFPEVSERRLTVSELQGLNKTTLWVMRNEVYARYGRPFSHPAVRRYFAAQPWYRVNSAYRVPTDDVQRLSPLEKANTALIAQYEKQSAQGHPTPAAQNAGLSYWYQSRELKAADLHGKSAWDLLVMRNQIYARHGRRFTYKPLQDYFSRQPWYRINPNYHDGLLSSIEKRNAGIIYNYEKKQGYL